MTPRKPARPKTYARGEIREIAFQPAHEELFALAAEAWTRPRKVRVRITKTSFTFEARFLTDWGAVAVLRTRARRTGDGKLFITERGMSLRFGFSAKAARP